MSVLTRPKARARVGQPLPGLVVWESEITLCAYCRGGLTAIYIHDGIVWMYVMKGCDTLDEIRESANTCKSMQKLIITDNQSNIPLLIVLGIHFPTGNEQVVESYYI